MKTQKTKLVSMPFISFSNMSWFTGMSMSLWRQAYQPTWAFAILFFSVVSVFFGIFSSAIALAPDFFSSYIYIYIELKYWLLLGFVKLFYSPALLNVSNRILTEPCRYHNKNLEHIFFKTKTIKLVWKKKHNYLFQDLFLAFYTLQIFLLCHHVCAR